MKSYAILGATGRVGNQILELLLQSDDFTELHLYARSKSKILSTHPTLANDPRVSIYEGDLNNTELIGQCIKGTKACFLTVALSENMPNCSIAMDTARIVVQALCKLRDEQQPQKFQPPKLIILSSSSVTDKFWVDIPRIVHTIIFNANRHIYLDLQRAETYLRDQSWIPMTFIKPGGLSDDLARGYKLDTQKTHTPMSFVDLGTAMIEIADDEHGTWDGEDVSIVPAVAGRGARLSFSMPYVLGKGLVACYLPSVYMYLRDWLP